LRKPLEIYIQIAEVPNGKDRRKINPIYDYISIINLSIYKNMNKTATYYPKLHQLTYWDSKNTEGSINCRNKDVAKMIILTVKHTKGVNQTLIINK